MDEDIYQKDTITRSYSRKPMSVYRRGMNPNSRNGWKVGHTFTPEQIQKMSDIKKGKHLSPNTEFKKGDFSDEKHFQWKGDNASYASKHTWISRKLGKPDTCEHCGVSGFSSRKIHWANISREYKREINDWIRLCVPCHKKYDLERIKNNV